MDKPLDDNAENLIAKFGYTVEIDDLDVRTPIFHRLGAARTADVNAGPHAATPIPIVHAAVFAIPCDDCYPA